MSARRVRGSWLSVRCQTNVAACMFVVRVALGETSSMVSERVRPCGQVSCVTFLGGAFWGDRIGLCAWGGGCNKWVEWTERYASSTCLRDVCS